MSFLSSSKTSYEEAAKSFKEKIDSLNKLNATTTNGSTSEDELTTIANEIKEKYDTVCESYNSLKSVHATIADTLVQLINQTLYAANLNKALDEYSGFARLVAELCGSDSKLSVLLSKLLELAQLYIAAIDDTIKQSLWVQIKDILYQLGEAIGELAVSAGLLDSDDLKNISETADANGHHEITSKKAKSLSSSGKTKHVGYIGNINKPGYVGQKAQAMLLFPGDTTTPSTVNVSIPLMKMLNTSFVNDKAVAGSEGEVFRIFGVRFLNKYDFYSTEQIENDGSDEDNTDAYVTGHGYLRFGGIVSSIGSFNTSTQQTSFRIMVAGSDSWSNGSIKRKGDFTFSDLTVRGKFDGASSYSTSNKNYSDIFADGIDVSFKITQDNISYTFSGTNLEYDESYADDHEIAEESGVTDYYFTGSCTLSEDGADSNDTSVSSYYTSKDVVVKISKSTAGYKVTFLLDPDSDLNTSATDDSTLSDPTSYLPFFAATAVFETNTYSESVSDTTDAMAAISALLDLSKMTEDEDDFDKFYPSLLDKLNNAKKGLTNSLLKSISEMENITTTASTVPSIYSSYDSTYSDTYMSKYSSYISALSSDLSEYTSSSSEYDIENLYNGTFEEAVLSDLTDINTELKNIMSDIYTSEKLIYDYEKKFAHCSTNGKIIYDISSALATFYNVVTGESSTLSSMQTTGTKIYTMKLNLSYSTWLNYYKLCPYGRSNAFEYFISKSSLQYLYLLSQTYNDLYKLSDYIDHFNEIKTFYRYIIVREISENCHNSKINEIINPDMLNLIKNYENAKEHIDCSLAEYNGYFLNPYITELFPDAEVMNTFDIEGLLTDTSAENKVADFDAIIETVKPVIYVCILNSATDVVKSKITKLFDFMNGYKVNIREALFGAAFYRVTKTIVEKNDSALIDYSANDIVEPDWLNYCQILYEYNQTINSDDDINPAKTFFKTAVNSEDYYNAILQQLCSEIVGAGKYFNYVEICKQIRGATKHPGEFNIVYNVDLASMSGKTQTTMYEFGPVYYFNAGALMSNGDGNMNGAVTGSQETITIDGGTVQTVFDYIAKLTVEIKDSMNLSITITTTSDSLLYDTNIEFYNSSSLLDTLNLTDQTEINTAKSVSYIRNGTTANKVIVKVSIKDSSGAVSEQLSETLTI